MNAFKSSSRHKGFSLLELLVAMSVGTIMLLAAAQFTMQHVELQSVRTDVASIQQKARLALEIIVGELQMAGYDPTGGAGAGFTAATASTVSFSADRNEDGDLGDAGEVMTFGLYDADSDGTNDLGLDQGEGYKLLASNVTGLSFLYTLADGSQTNTPADLTTIRSVKVSVTTLASRADRLVQSNGGLHYKTMNGTTSLPNLGLE